MFLQMQLCYRMEHNIMDLPNWIIELFSKRAHTHTHTPLYFLDLMYYPAPYPNPNQPN